MKEIDTEEFVKNLIDSAMKRIDEYPSDIIVDKGKLIRAKSVPISEVLKDDGQFASKDYREPDFLCFKCDEADITICKNEAHCSACGITCDPIHYQMMKYHMSFKDAVSYLAHRYWPLPRSLPLRMMKDAISETENHLDRLKSLYKVIEDNL